MERLIYLLIILTLISCDKYRYSYKDGVKFYYSDNISVENGEKLSSLIAKEIQQNENQEIRNIKEIMIDSGYFTLVLTIPFNYQVTGKVRGSLRGFASMLSTNQLNGIPVHIVVTDNNYNPLGYLTYKTQPYWERYEYQSGPTKITLSDKCDICWASNIDLVLRYELPELYKNNDSIKIDIDLVRDTVRMKVNIGPDLNMDSLTKQFNHANSEMFLLTFNSKTSIIEVIDKKTKKQLKTYGFRGRL